MVQTCDIHMELGLGYMKVWEKFKFQIQIQIQIWYTFCVHFKFLMCVHFNLVQPLITEQAITTAIVYNVV